MRSSLRAGRWRVGVPAALLVLAVAAADCGDDNDDNATPGATASAADDAFFGTPKKASG